MVSSVEFGVSRRSVVRGAVVVVVGGVVGYFSTRSSSAARRSNPGAAANAYGPVARKAGRTLTTLADLPTGGGVVVAGVVVSRSADGDVHAFSATCTHQGCTVGAPRAGVISCPCHGSQFNATTGAVIHGPAVRPLPPITVTVQGSSVVEAPS